MHIIPYNDRTLEVVGGQVTEYRLQLHLLPGLHRFHTKIMLFTRMTDNLTPYIHGNKYVSCGFSKVISM